MRRNVLIIGAVIVVILVSVVGWVLFRPPQEASAPIEAIPLVIETGEAEAVAAQPVEPTVAPTEAPVELAAATEPPAQTEVAAQTEVPVEANPKLRIFQIVQAESQARFIIDEVLRGSPKTVVGVTNQVAGQIAIDPTNLGAAQVGVIQVNARTLETDNEFRNRALKNQILRTDSYEFVTFEPVELIGLPESVIIGQSFSFQIVGNLTIRDRTLPITFSVIVTPASETRLTGLARANFLYADFGLVIPDAPSVNSVEDDVTLELEFVATAS